MMSTPTRNTGRTGYERTRFEPGRAEQALSRREEMAVSGAVMSEAPWALAGAAGIATAGADVVLHALAFHLAIASPLALGSVAFFAVAGAGALLRAKHSKALLWAQRNPWRFAFFPGAACAIVVFALSMLVDGGVFGSIFTALWHGGAAYGLTGLVGSVGRPRRARG
jgi:hypothetical protein